MLDFATFITLLNSSILKLSSRLQFARYSSSNSYIANIYSLIDINLNSEATNQSYQFEVGNINGAGGRSIFRNIYTYAGGTNRNLSLDNNAYSGTYNVSNMYYATRNDYSGAYSNKISPAALRQESFQNILNGDNAFDVENFVKYGYYPHLKWPDVMPNQEYIELPSLDDGNIDFLNIEDRKELDDERVEATLVFQNPGYDQITELTFDNGLHTTIISQENKDNKSKLKVIFSSPTVYASKYSLGRIKHRNSAGYAGEDVVYGAKQRIVEIDMYKNINNMNDFKKINSNTNQNFKLQTDLDFTNVSFNIGTFYGKLDGNGHTIRNIRSVNTAFISRVYGGTVKNLNVDNYINSGNSGYGGLIAQADNSANIYNVHMKNVSITDRNTYVGGLVGYTNGVLISNCSINDIHIYETNKNNIVYYGRYGGLVGHNNNTVIQNTYIRGLKMDLTYAFSTYGIGGIVGRHDSGYIQDCYAEGIITTNQQEVGGIAGYNNAYIERVVSVVDVYTQQDSVGGVVGYSTNDNILNTLVLGNVYTAKNAINQSRTIGNRTAVNSNYAWNDQLVNGLNANTSNGELLFIQLLPGIKHNNILIIPNKI